MNKGGVAGTIVNPASVKGSSKYGYTGSFTQESLEKFGLSASSKAALLEAGNHGLAQSTWSSYNTAGKMLALCSKDTGREFNFPLQEGDVLEFVGWLMSVRKVKSSTINSYLAGIRQQHIIQGMEAPVIRSAIVKQILKGKRNMDNIKDRDNPSRLPMTIGLMKKLKQATREWDAPLIDKLLMWAIATIAFHGGFRIHELLCKAETFFDPDFCLMSNDVTIVTNQSNEKMLKIRLKCPKEDKTGKAIFVEVHETQGTLCPVKAFARWSSRAVTDFNLPLFRKNSGETVTGKAMNKWLKARLQGVVDYNKGKYSSHSFRIGLASTMAEKGLSISDIKEAGRWSSKAYEIYLKLPQTKRANAAKAIAELDRHVQCNS